MSVLTGLPDGFEVQLKHDVRVIAGGNVLIGGSPMRVARLTAHGAALVRSGRVRVVDDASRRLADRLLDGNLASPTLRGVGVPAQEVTVVIPIRDRAEQLDRLLTGLRPRIDCLVVDDASHDAAAIADVARRHGARLVRHQQNTGPAAARNTGLRHVTTPYVAFVDSDVETDPETLLGLAGHFADPQVVAVAPRVRGVASDAWPRWFQRYDATSMSLDLGDEQSLVRPGSTVSWVPTACLVVRRDSVGAGFDESLRVAEDVDFVWRLVAAGGRVRYDANFEVRHASRGSLTAWLGRKVYYGTGGALLAERHGDLIAPAVMSPVFALATVALVAQRRWSAPVVLACTSLTAMRIRQSLPLEQDATREASRLAARGLTSVVAQAAQLVLRHWWPITLCALPFSRRARRALVAAAVVDTVLTPRPAAITPVDFFLARRLDDVAYGAGLWLGALRARSVRCLLPRGSSANK
ncbi:MAG: glycosyl transferase [Marmoricola sp.]|nr:glycosyl transferase [Marmoricola sp.]